ncbi:GDYXXLXY domain-containing protein [Chryseobacterium indoltheticum]|uniref:GDYXXLXY domain-containing protein n=1 Tax=Chryseobacterium indoltheticum TaxID=254 RepID=UPI0019114C40|nr:GDYXXLXY domain-containing protein [Chryseobacterium indoltheticum]QQQ30342.1 GDYXXLXY domain-containing protein [Chryseobacterium indoltheticum]
MKKYKWLIIVLNLMILLVYFNFSVVKKENLLKDGKLILLSLAPVDPRSLMQGDYMTLRYSISENLNVNSLPKRGYCVVNLNPQGIAEKVRFQKNTTPLNKGEYLIEYNSPDQWNVNIGAESFFFQEGQAEKYEKAKYGAIKVDTKGNSLLVGLYDENLKNIK